MSVLFIGGDMRQKYACEYLQERQIISEVYVDDLGDDNLVNKLKEFQVIVLPLPVSRDGIYLNSTFMNNRIFVLDVIENISPTQFLIGGKFGQDLQQKLLEGNNKFYDYNDDEYFQIQNALLSAEGAIYYAQEKLTHALHGLNIAILGFGRIGKIIAYLLHCQGAKISVYARKTVDCTWSEVIGFKALQIKKSGMGGRIEIEDGGYDLIFNTIPYQTLDETFARQVYKSTIIIDLASYPHGIDEKIAKKYNLNYYRELGIPGRYAPKSAGKILGKTIINILSQGDGF